MSTSAVVGYYERLHHLVFAQARDLQPTLDRILGFNPLPGAPTDLDYKTIIGSVRSEDRDVLWRNIQFGCLHMAVNVADHVRSLAMVLVRPDGGVPVYTHTTLARVAIEAATNIAYIHDSVSPFELRFARGIAFLIYDVNEARKNANRVPGNSCMPSPGPAATTAYEDLLAHIERAKIEITLNTKGELKGVRLSPVAPEALIRVNMTERVHERYPEMPGLYGILSGVTHGMPHRLNDNVEIAGQRADWDANPIDVGNSVLAAMHAADTALAAHAWHRGKDDDPGVAAARERTAAVNAEILRFARVHLPRPRPAPVARFLQSR